MKTLLFSVALSSVMLASSAEAAPTLDGGVLKPAVGCVPPKGPFRISFDGVELKKAAQPIADITCKVFIFAEGVTASKVTIVTPESGSFTAEQLLKTFVMAIEANGLTVTEQGNIVRISLRPVPMPMMPRPPG